MLVGLSSSSRFMELRAALRREAATTISDPAEATAAIRAALHGGG